MAYLTLNHIAGDPDALVEDYRRSSSTMSEVGRDHGLILHAAARTADGLLVVNLWPSPVGSESAKRDPRRLAVMRDHGLTPLARFVSFAARGVPPEVMGIGPIEAIPAALRYAGLQLSDLGWIELNEAFAAQSLAVMNTVGLDPAKVNPMGGAIALGHPLGATGAIRSATVVHALRRHNLRYGMVTMCVGTGQGAAGIFERV